MYGSPKLCEVCGNPMPVRSRWDRRTCSATCRKRLQRSAVSVGVGKAGRWVLVAGMPVADQNLTPGLRALFLESGLRLYSLLRPGGELKGYLMGRSPPTSAKPFHETVHQAYDAALEELSGRLQQALAEWARCAR